MTTETQATAAIFEFYSRNTMEFGNGHTTDYFSITYKLTTPVIIDGIAYHTVDVSRGINLPGGDFEFVSLFADRDVTHHNPLIYDIHNAQTDDIPYEDAPAWIRSIKETAYNRLGVINQV